LIPDRFLDAWQNVLDGTPVLGTAFVWNGRVIPAQGIVEAAILRFAFEDVSHLGDAETLRPRCRPRSKAPSIPGTRRRILRLAELPSIAIM